MSPKLLSCLSIHYALQSSLAPGLASRLYGGINQPNWLFPYSCLFFSFITENELCQVLNMLDLSLNCLLLFCDLFRICKY